MDDERESLVPDGAVFARTLGTLKRDGSNILLVGSVPTDVHETACQQMLGSTERHSRYRLFVTDSDDRAACSATGDAASERVRTIEYSATETEPAENLAAAGSQPSPAALGIRIVETIDQFAETAGGFEPSELRVCVDSLVPLLEDYDAETVFRLLHIATARVGKARGMGHYHVPLEPDHEAVSLLEPMFDAVVTVRSRNGTAEQQWYLREADTESDWLEL
ncbi:DUF7504 family protein [Natrinema marinum]|uniref:DUF7504 family protein n=1 Tax=Natrinema marinum TaxID=2961598 RepID=UPI0020C93614|nr:hypothetical protein [Natrinema marinum]